MLEQEKQLEELVAVVKKTSSTNDKVSKIIDFAQQKLKSSHHEECLIVEKILSYSEVEADAAVPALTPKEIAEVILKGLKDIKSLSIFLVVFNAWEKCKRTTAKEIDWKF